MLHRHQATAGAPLGQARAAAVLVHGRGQDARVMRDVVDRLALPEVAYLLPLAPGGSWYPGRYFDPLQANQPDLDQALDACAAARGRARSAGLPARRIVLGGFSQGACVVAELVARRPAPLAGVAVLTGCLMGPPAEQVLPAGVEGLTMFFSCGEDDDWIALADARASADAFARAGADVRFEVSAEPEHRIGDGDVAGLRDLLTRALSD